MEEPSDRDLLSRTRDGDRRAFAVLFDRHAPAVTRYAWALVSERVDVQELVQDTFITTWMRAASVSIADASMLPWLLVTCRNHAMNLRRRRARHQSEPLRDRAGARERERAEAQEQLRWVREEIASMNDIDRRVCEMCLIEGRSYREAAAAVGISESALGKRLERARRRIREAVMSSE